MDQRGEAELLQQLSRTLSRIDHALDWISNSKNNDTEMRQTVEAIALPLLELQEKQFFYSVIEHAADESAHDGEALDFKFSALLAAQAAIAAIFLDKEGPYFWAAITFTILTITSIVSLRLQTYQRAPNPGRFAIDFIDDSKAARDRAIVAKLDAITHNENLVKRKGRWFTGLLIATVVAFLVFLSWAGYNGVANGHSGATQATACQQQPGAGAAHKAAGGDCLGPPGKR
jgi:hypothetical protein